jgi:hypothetical protein
MAKVTRTARRSAAQVIEHDPGVDRVVHRRDERRRSRCSRRGVAGAPSDLVDAALPAQIWKDGWQIDAGLRGFVEESDACVVGRARLAASARRHLLTLSTRSWRKLEGKERRFYASAVRS